MENRTREKVSCKEFIITDTYTEPSYYDYYSPVSQFVYTVC